MVKMTQDDIRAKRRQANFDYYNNLPEWDKHCPDCGLIDVKDVPIKLNEDGVCGQCHDFDFEDTVVVPFQTMEELVFGD